MSTLKCHTGQHHELLADALVLKCESREDFYQLLRDLIAEHQPTTFTEQIAVDQMAAARWRQLRTWSMQKHSLDYEIAKQDPNLPLKRRIANALCTPIQDFFRRYDAAMDKQFYRAVDMLALTRAHRRSLASRLTETPEQPVYTWTH